MKIAVIVGTRPEIIKMSPVIIELDKQKLDYFVIHTGQHYSYDLDGMFIEQLKFPKSKYNLNVGSCSPCKQISKMIGGLEKVMVKESPDYILVLGDTNSVLAGALVSTKLHMKLGHIEAGLRSYDRLMQEETNRVIVDHCSDLLFTPTENSRDILVLKEGISEDKVFITGNTIVDALYHNRELSKKMQLNNGFNKGEYFLATIHRAENVDDNNRFTSIIESLKKVSAHFKLPIMYPIHPHSLKRAKEFKLDFGDIHVIPAMDYFRFLKVESNAKLIFTDSGGVQEESCILGVPCVTLRDNTERPETLKVGANILSGVLPQDILRCAEFMINKDNSWDNPFGDGKASERIVEILKR